MAEEKTILTVDLYDNVLTEKTGDFTGKIRITGTTRTSDISNRIVKKRKYCSLHMGLQPFSSKFI